ncbi:hypothetical protein SDC9_92143 [bioreactor metagenome]|uniref:Uncharacterized protein n=1 Tax=bioreactor metagenome TaxID=1076179 RepID=A0A644ZXL1_9ZZZZ
MQDVAGGHDKRHGAGKSNDDTDESHTGSALGEGVSDLVKAHLFKQSAEDADKDLDRDESGVVVALAEHEPDDEDVLHEEQDGGDEVGSGKRAGFNFFRIAEVVVPIHVAHGRLGGVLRDLFGIAQRVEHTNDDGAKHDICTHLEAGVHRNSHHGLRDEKTGRSACKSDKGCVEGDGQCDDRVKPELLCNHHAHRHKRNHLIAASKTALNADEEEYGAEDNGKALVLELVQRIVRRTVDCACIKHNANGCAADEYQCNDHSGVLKSLKNHEQGCPRIDGGLRLKK